MTECSAQPGQPTGMRTAAVTPTTCATCAARSPLLAWRRQGSRLRRRLMTTGGRRPLSIGEQLARCDGFLVRGRDGRTLGTIAWVRYASRADCPDVLILQRRGRFVGRARNTDIPSRLVADVDSAARTVTLAE